MAFKKIISTAIGATYLAKNLQNLYWYLWLASSSSEEDFFDINQPAKTVNKNPLVGTPFEENRWDYIYYNQPGNEGETQRYWLIVYFEGNRVIKIEKDVLTNSN